jgi:hypothetical protein
MGQSEYPNTNLSSILPVELREKTQLGIFKYCHSPFGVAFFLPSILEVKSYKKG